MIFSVFAETQKILVQLGVPCEAEAIIESTNDRAKKESNAATALPCIVYLADQQTRGRGRQGPTWLNTKPGDALLATWSLALDEVPQPILSPLVGLCVYDSLLMAFPRFKGRLSLKAPNDVLLDGRKLAGLLLESVVTGSRARLVIGLGLNVHSHPPELHTATHLALNDAGSVRPETWRSFMVKLHDGFLQLANARAAEKNLSDLERSNLREALNRNPHLPEPIKVVTASGDLATETETIHWTSL
jgi:biotin-[acetyl-CoA-carboxylase] ligase BirA-like protein